jgi:hypothetical protein
MPTSLEVVMLGLLSDGGHSWCDPLEDDGAQTHAIGRQRRGPARKPRRGKEKREDIGRFGRRDRGRLVGRHLLDHFQQFPQRLAVPRFDKRAPGQRGRALDAGEVVRLEKVDTLAGGLAPPFAGAITLEHAQAFVRDVVLVSDAELLDPTRFVMERVRLVIEPSAAAGVAALLLGRIPVQEGDTVVVILSGGNVGAERLAGWFGPTGA